MYAYHSNAVFSQTHRRTTLATALRPVFWTACVTFPLLAVVPDMARAQGQEGNSQAAGQVRQESQPGQAADQPVATLPALTVTGAAEPGVYEAYAGGQVARGGSLGVLGSRDVMETPFSTLNYTEEVIRDQQARSLADVVVNDASVRMQTSTGSFSDDFQIRGFSVSSRDVGINGLYGLSSTNRMSTIMVERVEILKGPGTLAYGISPSGSIGGSINIVTKRAGDTPITRLTTTYESKSLLGAAVDVGRRFGVDNQWGVRVNGLYKNGKTTIDHGKQALGVGALALDYRSPALRWSLDAYSQRDRIDNFRGQNGFKPGIPHLPAAPSGYRAIYDGADLTIFDSAVTSRLEYDINDHLMVYGAAGYRYGGSDQNFPQVRGADNPDEFGNFKVYNSWYDAYFRNKTGEIGARANFNTLGVNHFLTVSGSTLKSEAGSFYLRSNEGLDSNLYNPKPLIPMTGDRGGRNKTSETTLSGLTLTDTLSFADDRILLTGGLRRQNVKLDNFNAAGAVTSSYDESAISPLAGIVVRPWQNVSVYGNFTSGLTPGATAPASAANAGEVFAPYKSKQYEAGVKVDWGRVMTTASVFQIDRPNSITDPVTNIYSFDGEQRNRGLELSAVGEVTRGLRVMASAVFFDAKLQSTAGGINDGKRAPGVPKRTYNLAVDWDTPWVSGLSLNARAIHTGAMPYDAPNTMSLPSWTRYDIGARYRTHVMGKQVIFRANVENLFDKKYWLSSSALLTVATAAAPRTVLLSAEIEF